MKTSRLSTVSPSSTSNSPTSNTVGSRLFTPTKVDTSPLDFDNEKDLQKKLEEIVGEFKNKDKEWTFRLKSLQLLQRIINGNGIEIKGWNTLLRMISPSLIEQLTELRSTIVKEACQCVSLLAIRMKSRFESFALQYTQALMRMVPVKTTIISESAHQTLKDILDNVPTKGLMQTFLDASMDQHNEQLRKRASEYIYIVLNRAILNEGMLLVSSIPALEKSIQRLLVDGASETRQIARYCFWSYAELNEKSATALFYQFTPTTQKNLFTVQEHLVDDQLEICEKIKLSLFEEEQSQKLVEDSTDLDFDLNDFKKEVVNNNNSNSVDSSIRSKTPTTANRAASGLKNKVTTTTTTTNGSTSKIGGASTTTTGIRSGSSLGGRMDSSLGSSSIKKPLDASNIIRSKSSLGTTRKLNETSTGGSGIPSISTTSTTSSPITKTPTTMTTKTTSSSSPNLATTTQSGRYSSIGTRAITTSLSKQSSSSNLTRTLPPINKSPVSSPSPAPPAPTLTKSKSNPTSPISTSTTSQKSTTTSTSTTTTTNGATTPTRRISTTTTTTSTTSSPSSNLTSSIKRPSTIPSNGGTPKSSSSTTATSTTPKSSTTKTTSSSLSTPTSTTKKSFITKSDSTTSETTPTNIKLQKTTSSSSLSNTPNRKSINNEIDLESLEISLNQDNGLAFNEISNEISNNLLNAKKGLSFYEKEELTLDDLENNNNNSSNSGNNSNNNSKRSSVSSFTNSIKESTTADLEFNWLEDSVHDSLIEDDVLDFNDENNNSTFIPRNIKENDEDQEEDEEQQQQLDEDDDELMF